MRHGVEQAGEAVAQGSLAAWQRGALEHQALLVADLAGCGAQWASVHVCLLGILRSPAWKYAKARNQTPPRSPTDQRRRPAFFSDPRASAAALRASGLRAHNINLAHRITCRHRRSRKESGMDSFSARLNAAEGAFFASEQRQATLRHAERLGVLPEGSLSGLGEAASFARAGLADVPVTVINARPASEVRLASPSRSRFGGMSIRQHPALPTSSPPPIRAPERSGRRVQVVFRYNGQAGPYHASLATNSF